jgi:serine/threonine-protein kinase HipA
MTQRLDVWLYGTKTATITERVDRRFSLAWADDAVDRWGPGARLLSAKLPLGDQPVPPIVKNYLDGLLPEGNARVNHALSAGVPPDDTLALIRKYGRDTPGAAMFVPEGASDPTQDGRYEAISLDEVAERLSRADEHSPSDLHRITGESSTLPGMVPKITLHREGQQWYACKDGMASTWIIKRASAPDTGLADVVDTEVACLALARAIGLTTIEAEIIEHDGARAIAVSRYDRHAEGYQRIHQEDLAQAIGLNTQDPNRKFQWGSRMPSLQHAADALRLDGGNPDNLLRLAAFSLLVGNTDLHAKNISFIRHPDGRATLSPAYDIAMHMHHPRDNRRFALDINGKHVIDQISIDDLVAEGRSWGLPERRARAVVEETTTGLAAALSDLDRNAHPGVPSGAWDVVDERVMTATDPITRGVGAAGEDTRRRRGPRKPK